MSSTIQIKRATTAYLLAHDPHLAPGEQLLEVDTNKVKIGPHPNGGNWSALPYQSLTPAEVDALLAVRPVVDSPAAGAALIISGPDDGTDTWLQAEGSLDADLNLALPTDAAVDALRKKGVPAAAGTSEAPADGGFQLVGANDEPTWLQAAPYVSEVTGAAPPTREALDTLAGEGVLILTLGAPPDVVPDLAPGEARAYYDAATGELTIDVGENDS